MEEGLTDQTGLRQEGSELVGRYIEVPQSQTPRAPEVIALGQRIWFLVLKQAFGNYSGRAGDRAPGLDNSLCML